MRVSVLEDDPGYANVACAMYATIYLNDNPIDYVMTADEERGYILRYVVDEYNHVVMRDNQVVTEELRGIVRIELHSTRPGNVALIEEQAR